jgi:adenosine deaminase
MDVRVTDTTSRELRSLPKAHLHLHLEGAMRRETLQELAEHYDLSVSVEGDGSFASFIALYRSACEALRGPEDLGRLVHEIVADAATDGVAWVEISTWLSPSHATRVGVSDPAAVLDILLDAGQRASRDLGVGVGFILSANRTRPPEEAVELARLAARYVDRGVVGFGLADDETRGAADLFGEAFAIAREANLISAPHAGEHGGPDSVRAALDVLGARRVMHGVRSVEDPDLLRRLANDGITLDVCPTSNVVLSVVPSLTEHPLPRLIEAGVAVTLNADDPLFFNSGVLAEYTLAREQFGLDDRALAQIARTSIQSSGAPDSLKSTALAGITHWLEADA